jgi:NADH-quinone oxidoreductase subunit C
MSVDPADNSREAQAPRLPRVVERLLAAFPEAEHGDSADGIPFVRVPAAGVAEAAELLAGELGYGRFIDLTAVDDPERDDRFELQYLVYSMAEQRHFRLKARTADAAPSIVPRFPGADWYEREVWDLFGVHFAGHPNLTRIMLPDDWQGHPLRRDHPVGGEPVDFTVTREIYGT